MTLCYEDIEKQIKFWIIESKAESPGNIIVKSHQEKLKKLYDLLQEFFDYEELIEWGFTPDELFDKDEKTEGLIEDDEIPEVKESKVKTGDIWQLGNHRLMCGDSTSSDDVEKLMNGEKADIAHNDPPYGMKKENDGKKKYHQ